MRNRIKGVAGITAMSLSLALLPMSFARADCFKDISEDHWAHPAVKFLSGKGVFKGFQDGTFKGAQYVTRDEFVTIMNRLIEALEKELGVKVEKVK